MPPFGQCASCTVGERMCVQYKSQKLQMTGWGYYGLWDVY